MEDTIDELELRSEEVQEVLTAIPGWMIRWGNTLIFFLIIGLLGITWMVKYPDVIGAEATITTEVPPQKVYAKYTGNLHKILVADNQQVEANTSLAIIENSANYQDVFLLKSVVDSIEIVKQQFEFPIEKLPFLLLGDVAADFANFENNYYLYRLNNQWQPFSNQVTTNRQSLAELNSRLSNLESQQALNAEELEFKTAELKRQQSLFEEGLISAQDYETKQLENLQAKRIFKDRAISISQTQQAINNAVLDAKNIVINRNKEDQMLLRNAVQSFYQLKKAIKDWELTYVLKSNIQGQVTFLDFWTENQSINSGDLVFTVIPKVNKEYFAKLRMPSRNSGKIKIDQSVHISLENYPDTEYGTLKGKIKKVSLIADQEGYYIADVSLPSDLVTSYNKVINFRQEMRGRAEVVTEELRLIERFFYQFKQVFVE